MCLDQATMVRVARDPEAPRLRPDAETREVELRSNDSRSSTRMRASAAFV
jgi:hypothetical protein